MSSRLIEDIYTYDSFSSYEGRCGVQIYPGAYALPVVILTELPGNPGTSVTNMVEFLIAEVLERYLPDWSGFHCIEHYPVSRTREEESFDIVTFQLRTPRLQGFPSPVAPEKLSMGRPKWSPSDRRTVERLIWPYSYADLGVELEEVDAS